MIPFAAPVPGDAARDAADDVLSRAEYLEPQPSIVERVLEEIGSRIAQGLSGLAGGGPGGVLTIVVVVAVVAGAGYLLWRAGILHVARGPVVDHGPAFAQGADVPDDPDAWLRAARKAEERGDLRAALRCRHRQLVATIEGTDLVDRQPGRTPREFVAAVADTLPDQVERLALLTQQFEFAWYGHGVVDRAALAAFVVGVDDVLDAVGPGRRQHMVAGGAVR